MYLFMATLLFLFFIYIGRNSFLKKLIKGSPYFFKVLLIITVFYYVNLYFRDTFFAIPLNLFTLGTIVLLGTPGVVLIITINLLKI